MLAIALVSFVLVVACLSAWRWVAARRSRGDGRPASRPQPVLGMERVRQIRQAAEDAALQVALGHADRGRNPFRPHTREAVLWMTSFNARLMEFETEAFAPMPALPAWR